MKRSLYLMLIFLLVVSLGIFGCEKKEEEEEIKIGAILPLTGPAGQFGQFAKEGIDIAIDEISKQRDVSLTIRVLYEDSQGDPKNAVSILNKFTKVDKVDVVFVLTSGETLALIPIINQEKILTFTGTLLPGITEKSQYLLRNATSLDQETKFMADFLANKRNKPPVAVIFVNNDAGRVSYEQFKKAYDALSGEIVLAESYEPGASDFRTQLTKIKEKNPEYLYILSYKEFGLIMKQARELGIKATFIGTTTFEDPSGVKVAGESANGAIYTVSAFNPDSPTLPMAQFQEKYKAKYGRKAELYAALFRDNVHILARAHQLRSGDTQDMRNNIIQLGTFEGASGSTKFLPNGDVEKPLAFKRIRNGKFEYLENFHQ